MVEALQMTTARWHTWTRESLQDSWIDFLEPYGCESQPPNECYNFFVERREGSHAWQCAELFSWERDRPEDRLTDVTVYYSTKTKSAAQSVVLHLVEAFTPPEDAYRSSLPAEENELNGNVQWERRNDGRIVEENLISWRVFPQDGVWTIELGYSRFRP
jgi:hypothetical protein